MKYIYLFLFIFSTSLLFGQGDIKIVHVSDLNTDISGTEVEVVGSPSDQTIYYDMRVINLSGQSIDVKFKRVRLANSGRLDQICDENICYNADDQYEYTSPSLITVAHEDTTLFKPQIVPDNMESCGIHDYYVVNQFGIVFDSVRIKYRTTNSNCFLSVEDENMINNGFNMFPNPTENDLTIENLTSFDSEIIIHDALGKEILRTSVKGTSQNINLSDLKSGIYFVRIRNEKGHLTEPKKLVVKK